MYMGASHVYGRIHNSTGFPWQAHLCSEADRILLETGDGNLTTRRWTLPLKRKKRNVRFSVIYFFDVFKCEWRHPWVSRWSKTLYNFGFQKFSQKFDVLDIRVKGFPRVILLRQNFPKYKIQGVFFMEHGKVSVSTSTLYFISDVILSGVLYDSENWRGQNPIRWNCHQHHYENSS